MSLEPTAGDLEAALKVVPRITAGSYRYTYGDIFLAGILHERERCLKVAEAEATRQRMTILESPSSALRIIEAIRRGPE